MSTQFLDEAELIGDKMIVMDNGKVLIDGSPSYIKDRFGSKFLTTLYSSSIDVQDAI